MQSSYEGSDMPTYKVKRFSTRDPLPDAPPDAISDMRLSARLSELSPAS